MTITGDGLCFSNKFFIFYHEKSACKFLTNLFMTKHFVSYSKITLYQKKHACNINDYKALWYTMQICATGTTPTAAIRIHVK